MRFREAVPFLASAALLVAGWCAAAAPPGHDIVLSWEERAHFTGALIQGLRVRDPATGEYEDRYFGPDGLALDEADRLRHGIMDKDWSAGPRSRPAETLTRPAGHAAAALPERVAAALGDGAIPVRRFPAIDRDQLLREDAALAVKSGALRYGVAQALDPPVRVRGLEAAEGRWEARPDGSWVWRLALHAPEAEGQRLHFDELRLPAGAALALYNAADPREHYRIDSSGWTPTCFADRVVLECHAPSQAAAAAVSLRITQRTHQYRSLAELPWKAAGACNIDVQCHENWQTTALGIGGIGSIGSEGQLWCTGSLIAGGDPETAPPYFITANHCVRTPGAANTVEVYWLYQTDACGGGAPDPASVPRSGGGAEFLAGSPPDTGVDMTLLRLRGEVPAGIVRLGYNTAPQSPGAEVVCIHHPRGDFKRIAFGRITDSGSPSRGERLRPIQRYHEAVWDEGTTEPGSSGSPLLLRGLQQYIGQLWGGLASCGRPDEPDYYGRFDVAFPLVAAWLEVPANPYDVDGNGVVNSVDLQLVVQAALGNIDLPAADVTGSGRVDVVDVQRVVLAILNQAASR